jgi:hypothetical protein
MADDDNNRSCFNKLWIHSNTHVTLRSVSIVVPDDMIMSAKKNQGQSEWFTRKLHERSVQAFLHGRLNELRFVHNGEHSDEGTSIYKWFNVANYIDKMLMLDNKVLYGIGSTYWKDYHASVDYVQPFQQCLTVKVIGSGRSDRICANEYGSWGTDRLTKVINRESSKWLGMRLTALDYRHVAVSFGREKVGESSSHEDTLRRRPKSKNRKWMTMIRSRFRQAEAAR